MLHVSKAGPVEMDSPESMIHFVIISQATNVEPSITWKNIAFDNVRFPVSSG